MPSLDCWIEALKEVGTAIGIFGLWMGWVILMVIFWVKHFEEPTAYIGYMLSSAAPLLLLLLYKLAMQCQVGG